jgi:hypothetical protein
MYIVFILDYIHSFFNVLKKSNLFINVIEENTTAYNLRSNNRISKLISTCAMCPKEHGNSLRPGHYFPWERSE